MEVILEESAVGDSSGNGNAEMAVREVKAKTRSLRHQAEKLHGVEVGSDSPLVTWMVEYAANTINIGRRGQDGRTAWELRHGRAFKRKVVAFSEKAMYLPGGKRASRLEDKFFEGIFLGFSMRTDEALVGTRDGVVRARTIRRLGPAQRGEKELLNAIKGVVWKPVPSSAADVIPVVIMADPVVGPVALPLEPEAHVPGPHGPRRVYIRKDKELRQYGYTQGCPV
jgi:hypothetical protein